MNLFHFKTEKAFNFSGLKAYDHEETQRNFPTFLGNVQFPEKKKQINEQIQ